VEGFPSRADFGVYHGAALCRRVCQIALFTDGYEYHADPLSENMRTGKDSAQRAGHRARRAGFRMWSLTWGRRARASSISRRTRWSPIGGAPGRVPGDSARQNSIRQMQPSGWRLYAASSFDLFSPSPWSGSARGLGTASPTRLCSTCLHGEGRQGPPPDAIRASLQESELAAGLERFRQPLRSGGGSGGARSLPRAAVAATSGSPSYEKTLLEWSGLSPHGTPQTLRFGRHRSGFTANGRIARPQSGRVGRQAGASFSGSQMFLQFAAGVTWVTSLGLRRWDSTADCSMIWGVPAPRAGTHRS